MINAHSIFVVITLLIANYLLCQCLTLRIDNVLRAGGALSAYHPHSVSLHRRLGYIGGGYSLVVITGLAYAISLPMAFRLDDPIRLFLLGMVGFVAVLIFGYLAYLHFCKDKVVAAFIRAAQVPVKQPEPITASGVAFSVFAFFFWCFWALASLVVICMFTMGGYMLFSHDLNSPVLGYIGGTIGFCISVYMTYISYLKNS